jgi:hypothetical protein
MVTKLKWHSSSKSGYVAGLFKAKILLYFILRMMTLNEALMGKFPLLKFDYANIIMVIHLKCLS